VGVRTYVVYCANVRTCRPAGSSYATHYGKPALCRVRGSLPSAKFQTLGKDLLCRVLHSAKPGTRQRGLCLALGKVKARHSAKIGRGQTASRAELFCRVPNLGTQQNNFFFVFWHQIFFETLLHYHKQHVKIWHILLLFVIFL
jgi:hypothetical protein